MKIFFKTFILFLILAGQFSTRGFAAGTAAGITNDSTYLESLNLSYQEGERPSNLMDIFLPLKHSTSTRMIVFVHGGFWSKGSKNQLPKALIKVLTDQGYGVAAFNYHLVKDDANKFPVQMEDMKKAFAFLNAHADSLGYSNKEYALLGASAGAHLALLYTFAYDKDKKISTVIDLFGPTDLTAENARSKNPIANPTISRFLGNEDPGSKIARDASPIYQLTKKTGVPTIIFHGEADDIVDVSQSVSLYKKLNGLGIKTELVTYPGEKHELRPKMFDVFMKISKWLSDVYAPERGAESDE